MKRLQVAYNAALLRVDFEDEDSWRRVRDAALTPLTPGGASNLIVIDDRDFEGVDFAGLQAAPDGYDERVLVIFDKQTREHPDNPMLLIDWFAEVDDDDEERFTPGAVRITPDQVPSAEANLSLANMDFEDYAAAAGTDGIFRGFR